MRSRRQRRIEDLRLAVECLPERTKRAMLDGIARTTTIVGACPERNGGVGPMLAAPRQGGRTNLLAFARAWDRFCGAKRPRVATEREMHVLRAHLEASLYDASRDDFAGVIADHQATARDRRAREAERVGLGWMRRRSDETVEEREPELV